MKFLLSNDDGYFSAGIQTLAASVKRFGETMVIAPQWDRSGASNSLTLDRPLYMRQASNGFYYVNGTPTDCIHLAIHGQLCPFKPELIISGINHGENMGDDTLYSGTVAAAMEGFLLGIPSIAVSLASRECHHFDTAAQVITDLIQRFKQLPPGSPTLLNVNIPDISYNQLRGIKVTCLGRRHRDAGVQQLKSPRDESIYWIVPSGSASESGKCTDFSAVKNNWVSVTPLQVDLTAFSQIDYFSSWIVG